MKVIIDNKEYEGNEVLVKSEIGDVKFKEKPKKEFTEVPKEIVFHRFENDDLGLISNNHILIYYPNSNITKSEWSFEPVFKWFNRINRIDCVLVPVKREELKAGDFIIDLKEVVNKSNSYNTKRYIENYYLYVGDNVLVNIYLANSKFFRIDLNNLDIIEDANWYKVVQRNEVI